MINILFCSERRGKTETT